MEEKVNGYQVPMINCLLMFFQMAYVADLSNRAKQVINEKNILPS